MSDIFYNSSSPFISVLASLLGVLLGFFLNNLSRRGRIKIFQNDISIYFLESDEYGGYIPKKEITDKTVSVSVKMNLDLYNTSSYSRKIARDIKMKFKGEHGTSFSNLNNLNNINLLPNELMNLSISFGVNVNLDEIKNSPWEFVYYNEKNKLVKVKINKEQLFAENK
ncbi:hypothetical protein [Proteiniphilum propionicum]|uniref:hypothetical protein n=1 Tax=Proteiniphilum propionicum TaxID=2829812 RepID=UPI001EEB4277|nr:hypothetical protein [Proteiniphilum propionicum]ULB35159.1 hypothetical protein KDN43_03715 [Proteiniphilum propionicum]